MIQQRTLKSITRAVGVGVHSGQKVELTLRPAPPDTGIVFRRTDLPVPVDIPVSATAVSDTRMASTISPGGDPGAPKVQTIEHLMSACAGLGLDNLVIEITAEEVPILDGSAASFVFLLQSAGIALQKAPKRFLRVKKAVEVREGEGKTLKWARLEPHHGYKLAFEIEFNNPALDATGQHVVFDFSAGWQSTFLEAPMVHAMLTTLLAPAQAVTGIAVPGEAAIAALRLAPQGQPAQAASAAAWIHLYAATLWLFVVAPRLVLSALAFLRAATLALRVQVPLKGGAFGQLGRWHRAGAALVQVLPYAQAPGAQTALGLRELLASELGPDVQVKIGDVTAVGDEDAVAARAGSAGGVLRVALVDLAATPEDEHHGRLLAVLGQVKPAATVLLLVDEAAFRARFVSMTARIEERRTAWREFANRHGARLLLANLDRADEPEAAAALKLALQER